MYAIRSYYVLAGMSEKTPAAIIQNGTRANQIKLIADIGTLYEKAIDNKRNNFV